MSATLESSQAIRVAHLWRKLGGLGEYAGRQFALELVHKSSAALDLLVFCASCRAGEAVREGKAGEDFVVDVLIEAAAHAMLPQSEAQRIIKSGMRRT